MAFPTKREKVFRRALLAAGQLLQQPMVSVEDRDLAFAIIRKALGVPKGAAWSFWISDKDLEAACDAAASESDRGD